MLVKLISYKRVQFSQKVIVLTALQTLCVSAGKSNVLVSVGGSFLGGVGTGTTLGGLGGVTAPPTA